MDFDFSKIADVVLQLEGPYRWYIIGFVLIVLTALVTKFIFKTIKWFFVLAALAFIVLMVVKLFSDFL